MGAGQKMKQFIITKKIAKHGSQAIIVVPRVLEQHLKPKTLVKLTIDIIEEPIPENSQKARLKSD